MTMFKWYKKLDVGTKFIFWFTIISVLYFVSRWYW